MKRKLITLLHRTWREDEAVLSFEWVLLLTLLTIGIVGGIAAARDALIDELGDVTEAAISLDQSYWIMADPELNIPESKFVDEKPFYHDCDRTPLPEQQDQGGQGNPP